MFDCLYLFGWFFYLLHVLNLRLKLLAKLNDSSFKNTTFSSFPGGTSPQTPPVLAFGADSSQVHPPM